MAIAEAMIGAIATAIKQAMTIATATKQAMTITTATKQATNGSIAMIGAGEIVTPAATATKQATTPAIVTAMAMA